MEHLPTWINLKTMLIAAIVCAGLWLLFKVLGGLVKILLVLALIGAGIFLVWKFVN